MHTSISAGMKPLLLPLALIFAEKICDIIAVLLSYSSKPPHLLPMSSNTSLVHHFKGRSSMHSHPPVNDNFLFIATGALFHDCVHTVRPSLNAMILFHSKNSASFLSSQ
ncbi:hypothetical protein LguiA_010949 [Lonicera macranthoides]